MCECGWRDYQGIYLFLVSNFRSREPHQKLLWLLGSLPRAWLALGSGFPSCPLSPPPVRNCGSLMGLRGMNILNYSPLSRD